MATEAAMIEGMADAEMGRLVSLGARVREAVKEATVLDPFGNVFGIIENPFFDVKTVR
jgi:triphosphoribosyl-dephospho-CoA synthetase